MPIETDIFAEFARLTEAARDQQILLRAIGGLAVRVHSRDFTKFFQRFFTLFPSSPNPFRKIALEFFKVSLFIKGFLEIWNQSVYFFDSLTYIEATQNRRLIYFARWVRFCL